MTDTNSTQIHATGEATGFIPAPGDKGKPITVIGTNSIRAGFDATCLRQALNARVRVGIEHEIGDAGRLRAHVAHARLSRPGRRGHQMLDELPAARPACGSGSGQNRPSRAD